MRKERFYDNLISDIINNLIDKKEDKVVNYNKEEMEKILDLKEC